MALEPATLLCLHHAGGSAMSFSGFRAVGDDHVRCLPCNIPLEKCSKDADDAEIVDAVISELEDEVLARLNDGRAGRIGLYGHSMGGMLAFAIAQRLEDRQIRVKLLALGGCAAPTFPFHALSHDAPREQLIRFLYESGGLPRTKHAERIIDQVLLPRLRVGLRLVDSWRRVGDRAAVRAPILALTGAQDALVPPHAVAEWQMFTRSTFRSLTVPGGHLFHQGSPETYVAVRDALLDVSPQSPVEHDSV